MTDVIRTDAVIIGAGPCGLFAVFQLGLVDVRCHVVDALDRPGGQCAALYPEKPIYDIPALPVITGAELIQRLVTQIRPFNAHFHYGQTVTTLRKQGPGDFVVETDGGLRFSSTVVVVAAGGISPHRPSPLAEWGLDLHDDLIAVDTAKFESSVEGIFAIGDINSYPGKLKLILSGFHEAALMAQEVFRLKKPGGRLQYTTSSSSLQKKLGVS